jgi:glyoxylase-like metal-dependent hydrolase (beta-lactamase superfamily II)
MGGWGRALAAAVALGAAEGAAWAQAIDFAKIESRVTRAAGNVYMIDGVGGFAGGNVVVFGQAATVIAHDDVRRRMAPDEYFNGPPNKVPMPKTALPVITLSERATVHVNDEDIRALHTAPGHARTPWQGTGKNIGL